MYALGYDPIEPFSPITHLFSSSPLITISITRVRLRFMGSTHQTCQAWGLKQGLEMCVLGASNLGVAAQGQISAEASSSYLFELLVL
jgi:hypothetical protein